MQPWITQERRVVFQPAGGRYLTVEEHAVELPDGQVIDDWLWLITPDFVNVLVETADGRFACFRQTKYAVDGVTLAVVGGYIDAGEDPLEAAKREVGEELGMASDHWTDLGCYPLDGNRGAGLAHLYLARGAVEAGELALSDDLEEQEVVLLNRAEIDSALANHDFKSISWATTVALGLAHIDRSSNS